MKTDRKQTLADLIDRQTVAFIGSVDAEGFPGMRAMLAPRVREGLPFGKYRTIITDEESIDKRKR